MFGSFVEECVGVPDAVLDDRLRANELGLRRLMAERAALVGVAERRRVFAGEHCSMAGYLRATLNGPDAAVTRDRRLARLLGSCPQVGEALWAGHITVEHAAQICRVQSNVRVRDWLSVVVPVLTNIPNSPEHASTTSSRPPERGDPRRRQTVPSISRSARPRVGSPR